jgi:hypothetical protein
MESPMSYVFDFLEIQSIGNAERGSRRVVLMISLRDPDGFQNAELEAEISVPDKANATAAEIETTAFERAKILVSTAADVLSRGNLSSLKSAANPHD